MATHLNSFRNEKLISVVWHSSLHLNEIFSAVNSLNLNPLYVELKKLIGKGANQVPPRN